MSNSIIQVSNLSKSYTITHEGKERYTALRDVMAQKVKKIFSFPSALRGACPVAGFSKMNFIAMILPRCYGGTTKQSAYKEEFRALQGNYICLSFFKLVIL